MTYLAYEIIKKSGNHVEIAITADQKVHTIFFKSSDINLEFSSEAVVACVLYFCMASSLNLKLDSLDEALLENLGTIQNISKSWFPGLATIQIDAHTLTTRPSGPNKGASFFSGGLDSFFTLEKNLEHINYLVFVHGFDVELDDTPARKLCSQLIRSTASNYKKQAVEIETNLRDLIDDKLYWGYSHGAALMAVAHLMKSHINVMYVASSYDYKNLFPWGSHPLLDPLWQTPSLHIIHDGCEVKRVEKASIIADSEYARANLRVCWKNPENQINCGVCEKCIRTMINLSPSKHQDYSKVFPNRVSPSLIRSIPFLSESAMIFARENYANLQMHGVRPDLKKALLSLMNRSKTEIAIRLYYKRRVRKWRRALRKIIKFKGVEP